MVKLLIVDDEEIICNSIATTINWEALDIQLAGTCLDGVEAYHAILDECPDIVMTDIRMPGISGLELVERISRTDLNTQFIILSGYGEFEYAKIAMKYGIKHYLLKPCDEKQITDCILDVIQDCRQLALREDTKKEQNHVLRNLQKTLIFNMIREGISMPELDADFFQSYNHYVNLEDTSYQLCSFYYVEEKNQDKCREAVLAFFGKYAPEHAYYGIYVSNVFLLFFANYSFNYEKLDQFFETLSFPGQSVTPVYERIPYPDLLSLLNTQIPKLKRFDKLYFMDKNNIIVNYNYGTIVLAVNRLIPHLIEDSENITENIATLSKLLGSITDRDFLIQLANNLLISLNIKLSNNTLSAITGFLYEIHEMVSLEEICAKTRKRVTELLNAQYDATKHYSAFIEKLIRYTEEHLSDPDLTLKWISENYLYMNVNYVSRCFFKETNQKFSNHLMHMRVNKAQKILMEDKNIKIQDLAEMVGCGNNPYYFSRIFKKCTGITPSAYLKNLI